MHGIDQENISRRGFLCGAAAALGASMVGLRTTDANEKDMNELTFALYTDPHYADHDTVGTRHYRDSLAKLTEFLDVARKEKIAFAIELGDFIDSSTSFEKEEEQLGRIEKLHRKFGAPVHHVIGNHDVARFTKEQFMKRTKMPSAHYVFDLGFLRCIVLDANFKKGFEPYSAGNFDWKDTWIPPQQQKWLKAQLDETDGRCLIFVHQPLDDENGPHGVKNAPDVRKLLEASGKIVAVFQGHNHAGAYRNINGIPYFTMRAMVEGPAPKSNAYALVTVKENGSFLIRGFRTQTSWKSMGGAVQEIRK